VKIYTDQEGLPHNSVEAMAVDTEGYLWVGTQAGAACFNGRRWLPYRLPSPGESQWIRCMVRTRDGGLWFGRDQGGIARFRNGDWRQYGVQEGLPDGRVQALLEREDGTLLAGTSRGLMKLDGESWVPLKDGRGQVFPSVLSLLEDRKGDRALWVGTERGLAVESRGSWTWQGVQQGLPDSSVWSLYRSVDGTLWAGTGRGLARLEKGRWRPVGPSEGVPANVVNCILETEEEDGRRVLYVATDGGLGERVDGRWRFLNTSTGLPNQVIRSLL